MRVLAAMSGGVDSAVAAARAVAAGHEVTGVHLALSRQPASQRVGARGCCSLEDAHDARRAADALGIPFYVWDTSAAFETAVIEDFVAEYTAGRTPNPCIRCNERIKFASVLDRALALGFDAVCTGHYARLVQGGEGPELHRAADHAKDQSYVLGGLSPGQLSHCIFPLGGSVKGDVRVEAAALGLQVAAKPDSHDICFIPDGNTAGFLRDRVGAAPGEIVDVTTGEVLGQHDGAFAFTRGQRRGLALSRPATDGAPRYVVDVQIATRRVLVGPPRLLDTDSMEADRSRWCGPAPEVGARVGVQIRAHGEEVPGSVASVGDGFRVELDRPVRAVTPGQSAVLYDGTRVVGSGIIRAGSESDLRGAAMPGGGAAGG